MTAIPGTVIGSPLVPSDTTDVYATHEAEYGKGGWRTVADTTERDAIVTGRRQEGMIVYCQADYKEYQLGADLLTWTEYSSVGSTGLQNNALLTASDGMIVNSTVFDNSGDIGIGTTGRTGVKLTVAGTDQTELIDVIADSGNAYTGSQPMVRLMINGVGATGVVKGNFQYNETLDSVVVGAGSGGALYLNSSNQVGVGNIPEAPLHVIVSDASVAPDGSAAIVIEKNGAAALQLLTGDAHTAYIIFGRTSQGVAGYISYDHATDRIIFNTNTKNCCVFHETGMQIGAGLTGENYSLKFNCKTNPGTLTMTEATGQLVLDTPMTIESTKRVACGGGNTGGPTTATGSVTLEINGITYRLLAIPV